MMSVFGNLLPYFTGSNTSYFHEFHLLDSEDELSIHKNLIRLLVVFFINNQSAYNESKINRLERVIGVEMFITVVTKLKERSNKDSEFNIKQFEILLSKS